MQYRLRTLFIGLACIAIVMCGVNLVWFVEPTYLIYIRMLSSDSVNIENGCKICRFGVTIGRVKSVQKDAYGRWLLTAEINQSCHLRQTDGFYYVSKSNGVSCCFVIQNLGIMRSGSDDRTIEPYDVVHGNVGGPIDLPALLQK